LDLGLIEIDPINLVIDYLSFFRVTRKPSEIKNRWPRANGKSIETGRLLEGGEKSPNLGVMRDDFAGGERMAAVARFESGDPVDVGVSAQPELGAAPARPVFFDRLPQWPFAPNTVVSGLMRFAAFHPRSRTENA
jgi:hypothetical protein